MLTRLFPKLVFDFHSNAPEIEASPAGEPEFAPVPEAVRAADKHSLTSFP